MTSDDSTLRQVDSGGGRFERAFFDVRVFNPSAKSNQQASLSSTYRRHEMEKKRSYEQRIREVEHSTFTPLVLSSTGGMGKAATTFYKRLSSMLSEKRDVPYSTMIGVGSALPCFEHRSCRSEAQGHLGTDQSYLSLSRFKLLRDTVENLTYFYNYCIFL